MSGKKYNGFTQEEEDAIISFCIGNLNNAEKARLSEIIIPAVREMIEHLFKKYFSNRDDETIMHYKESVLSYVCEKGFKNFNPEKMKSHKRPAYTYFKTLAFHYMFIK